MIDLKLLTQKIPCQWRIGQVYETKLKASCLAYIDARDAMDLLDRVVGPENWQDDYKVVKDQLVAGVGIRIVRRPSINAVYATGQEAKLIDDSGEWVWKWDTGTAGNFEEEKSIFSDSFKRACVKWGIGRFLYSMTTEWVDVAQFGKSWRPVEPQDHSKVIWDLTKHIASKHKYDTVEGRK